MSAGKKIKKLSSMTHTKKKKLNARITRVEEEEISDESDVVSKLESASKVRGNSREIQANRSCSPKSLKRRLRERETSLENEESVASTGKKERTSSYQCTQEIVFWTSFCYSSKNCAELSRWPKEKWGKKLILYLEGRGLAALTKKLMSGNPSYGTYELCKYVL